MFGKLILSWLKVTLTHNPCESLNAKLRQDRMRTPVQEWAEVLILRRSRPVQGQECQPGARQTAQ